MTSRRLTGQPTRVTWTPLRIYGGTVKWINLQKKWTFSHDILTFWGAPVEKSSRFPLFLYLSLYPPAVVASFQMFRSGSSSSGTSSVCLSVWIINLVQVSTVERKSCGSGLFATCRDVLRDLFFVHVYSLSILHTTTCLPVQGDGRLPCYSSRVLIHIFPVNRGAFEELFSSSGLRVYKDSLFRVNFLCNFDDCCITFIKEKKREEKGELRKW